MGRDFYAILGVSRTATPNELKKAYRRLAMQWHPDKNKGNEEQAQAKFQEISDAYSILSDPEKRSVYDRFGEEGLTPGGGSGGGGFGSHVNPEDLFRSFFGDAFGGSFFSFGGGFDDDFGSPFGSFHTFGSPFGGFGRSSSTSRRLRRMEPEVLSVMCSLEQLFTGTEKTLRITRNVDGTDHENVLHLEIPPGTLNGTKFTFEGEGTIREGFEPQDVIFKIKELDHPRFVRDKDDLLMHLKVSLKEALCGINRTVTGIDQKPIDVKVTNILKPGTRLRFPGQGMTSRRGGRGDLYIDFDIIFPDDLPEDCKLLMSELLPDLE